MPFKVWLNTNKVSYNQLQRHIQCHVKGCYLFIVHEHINQTCWHVLVTFFCNISIIFFIDSVISLLWQILCLLVYYKLLGLPVRSCFCFCLCMCKHLFYTNIEQSFTLHFSKKNSFNHHKIANFEQGFNITDC